MLERACVSAEPAAQLFLRNIEAPLRSKRTLGSEFWKHGGERIKISAWWPQYLESVRQVPQYQETKRLSAATWDRPVRLPQVYVSSNGDAMIPIPGRRRRSRTRVATRQFTSTVVRSQLGTDVQKSSLDDMNNIETSPTDFKQEFFPDSIESHSTQTRPTATPSESLETILGHETPTDEDYHAIWRLFVSFDYDHERASRVFHFLAKSTERRDIERAMDIFRSMSIDDRDLKLYGAAIDIELQRHRYKHAVRIAEEAVDQGVGIEHLSRLLAHCIRTLAWSSAAKVWVLAQKAAATAGETQGSLTDINSAILLSECVRLPDLPVKVVTLTERLGSIDAVYSDQRPILLELGAALASNLIKSPNVMQAITAKGLLSILELENDLSIADVHEAAINTLAELPNKAGKAQLAIMVYRNYRFVHSDKIISDESFDALISICASAGLKAYVYKELFDDHSIAKRAPSEAAFVRVLKVCAHQGDITAVHQFFELYQSFYGQPKDLGCLRPLIYVHTRLGDFNSARIALDRIQTEFNLVADVHCWNMLLRAFARVSNVKGAVGVLREMRKRGVEADQYTFASLVGMYLSVGNIDEANKLIQEAQRDTTNWSIPLAVSVVNSYLRNGRDQKALRIVQKITESKVDESVVELWNCFLHFYAKKGDPQRILSIQQSMKKYGVLPNAKTYHHLMEALTYMGKVRSAVVILRSLNLTQTLTVIPDHYAVLIRGCAAKGDRDMATVLYHEMLELFQSAPIEARISMLQIQAQRDVMIAHEAQSRIGHLRFDYKHAHEFLADALLDISPSDMVHNNIENAPVFRLFETLAKIMLQNDCYEQAGTLLQTYGNLYESDFMNMKKYPAPALRLAALKIDIATYHRQWEKVDELWKEALSVARLRLAAASVDSVTDELSEEAPVTQATTQQGDVLHPERQEQTSEVVFGLTPDELFVDEDVQEKKMHHKTSEEDPPLLSGPSETSESTLYEPMILEEAQSETGLPQEKSDLILAQSYALSYPLNKYMQALDMQRRHLKIFQTVDILPRFGFQITSKNWNTYVQLLSKSSDVQYRIRAFFMFEKLFADSTPSWPLLLRGLWVPPESGGQAVKRSWVDNQFPWRPVPTYTTTVYLALALLKIQQSADALKPRELNKLRSVAPKTLSIIRHMPNSKDRLQGVLLRGQRAYGDPVKKPEPQLNTSVNAGILGSKSPIDNVSPEHLLDIENLVATRQNMRSLVKSSKSEFQPSDTEDVRLAEKLTGEIYRQPIVVPSEGRYEDAVMAAKRIAEEEQQKLQIIQAIREDARRRHLVAEPRRGDPAIILLPGVHHAQPFATQFYAKHFMNNQTQPSNEGASPSIPDRHGQDSTIQAISYLEDNKSQMGNHTASYQTDSAQPLMDLPIRRVASSGVVQPPKNVRENIDTSVLVKFIPAPEKPFGPLLSHTEERLNRRRKRGTYTKPSQTSRVVPQMGREAKPDTVGQPQSLGQAIWTPITSDKGGRWKKYVPGFGSQAPTTSS